MKNVKRESLVLSDPEFTEGESKGLALSKRSESKGFTLIELLITLTIIGILFTIGYVEYRRFAKRQVLVNAHEKLKTDLNLARQVALSGEKAICSSGTTLDGYRISFTSTNYSVSARCRDANNALSYPNLPDINGQLPTGITFSSPPSPILFKVIGQGTDLTSNATITLNQSNNQPKTVTITKEGLIQ